MRRRLLGPVLGLLLVIEIVVAVLVVQAQPGGFGALADVNVGVGPERTQVQPVQTFDLGNTPANLTVDSDNGKVEVIGDATASKFTVNATKVTRKVGNADSDFDNLVYQVTRNGNNITVTAKRKNPVSVGINFGSDRVDISITAPQSLVSNLKTDNGTIMFRNFENTSAAHRLQTDNGTITVTNIKAVSLTLNSDNGRLIMEDITGDINAQGDNGTISATRVKANTVKLKSDNGRLIAEDVSGTVNAESDNGAIEVRNGTLSGLQIKTSNGAVDVSGALKLSNNGSIRTDNGRVSLRIATDNLPRFNINTDNGSISFNLPDNGFERNERKHLTTKGSGPTLDITTSNGSITLNRS